MKYEVLFIMMGGDHKYFSHRPAIEAIKPKVKSPSVELNVFVKRNDEHSDTSQ
jgi:hypothetical protein